ncbi:MAG: hypothetical protein IT579_25120 [Verrucomicrobia subdivision 3 bacterium]|nr:hypothetical protein [Limisphaerales bacterium]
MTFAALEARLTTVSLVKLANATVVLGAESAGVVFDGPSRQVFDGMVHTTEPQIQVAEGALAGLVRGAALTVDAVAYTVTSVSEPDRGILTATLRKT